MAVLPAGAVKKIDANPINVAFILSQETDSDEMSSTLEYYGYERQTSNDGYYVFKNPNGSVVKYTFKDATEAQPYPRVEVKSNRGSKDIDDTLESLSFKKEGNKYIRNTGQYAKTETHCTNGSQGFLIFHRVKINSQE